MAPENSRYLAGIKQGHVRYSSNEADQSVCATRLEIAVPIPLECHHDLTPS